jgi:hypothetical protein
MTMATVIPERGAHRGFGVGDFITNTEPMGWAIQASLLAADTVLGVLGLSAVCDMALNGAVGSRSPSSHFLTAAAWTAGPFNPRPRGGYEVLMCSEVAQIRRLPSAGICPSARSTWVECSVLQGTAGRAGGRRRRPCNLVKTLACIPPASYRLTSTCRGTRVMCVVGTT